MSLPRLAWLVRQAGAGRKLGQTASRALVSIGDRGPHRVLDPGRPREVALGSLVSADGLVHLLDQVGTQRMVAGQADHLLGVLGISFAGQFSPRRQLEQTAASDAPGDVRLDHPVQPLDKPGWGIRVMAQVVHVGRASSLPDLGIPPGPDRLPGLSCHPLPLT